VINYEELASNIEQMREIFRALVAGLVADGFTDEQARALVVAMTTNQTPDE
jgi:uncharacterized membrane protein YebE (DUF533 family)